MSTADEHADGQPDPGHDTGAADGPEAQVVDPEVLDEDDYIDAAPVDAAEVPPEEADPRSPEELREALEDAERTNQEYLDHLRRERAEFENFRRRSAKEHAEARSLGTEQLATTLLPVLDNFAHVLNAAEESSDQALSKGVEMVHGDLLKTLADSGLERIDQTGLVFDPQVHEAVSQVSADEPTDEPVVHQVLRVGYRFADRVLRPASVVVEQ